MSVNLDRRDAAHWILFEIFRLIVASKADIGSLELEPSVAHHSTLMTLTELFRPKIFIMSLISIV